MVAESGGRMMPMERKSRLRLRWWPNLAGDGDARDGDGVVEADGGGGGGGGVEAALAPPLRWCRCGRFTRHAVSMATRSLFQQEKVVPKKKNQSINKK